MKLLLVQTLLLNLFIFSTSTSSQNKISPDDLNVLIGSWEGTLTYMDYRTNKPYSMPTNVVVEQGSNPYQLTLRFSYPNEPQANSKDKIRISKDGSHIDKARITSKQNLADDALQFTTEAKGKDNTKKAIIKKIYILGKDRFIIRKEVKFEDSDNWIVRNEYNFSR